MDYWPSALPIRSWFAIPMAWDRMCQKYFFHWEAIRKELMDCNGLHRTPLFLYHLTNLSPCGASSEILGILNSGPTRDSIMRHMNKLSITCARMPWKTKNSTFLLCVPLAHSSFGKEKTRSKTLNLKISFSSGRTYRRLWASFNSVKST